MEPEAVELDQRVPPKVGSRRSVKGFSRSGSNLTTRSDLETKQQRPPVPSLPTCPALDLSEYSSSRLRDESVTPTIQHKQSSCESPTALAYLAPSPQKVSSPGGFEAIGQIALQSATLQSAFPRDRSLPPNNSIHNTKGAELEASLGSLDDRKPPQYSGQPPGVANEKAPENWAKDLGQIKTISVHGEEDESPELSDQESFDEVVKLSSGAAQSPARGQSATSHLPTAKGKGSVKATSLSETRLTWKERLQRSFQAYDDPNASSHSLPRFHRMVEPAVLLLPIIVSFYLVGSAIVPFEWWRARLSIARVGLAGQSAESDDRIVEGEEIGLFGVWGWCVMNSEEV